MVPSLLLLSCESSVSVKKTLIEKKKKSLKTILCLPRATIVLFCFILFLFPFLETKQMVKSKIMIIIDNDNN